jgi:hypothetical protein
LITRIGPVNEPDGPASGGLIGSANPLDGCPYQPEEDVNHSKKLDFHNQRTGKMVPIPAPTQGQHGKTNDKRISDYSWHSENIPPQLPATIG